MNAIFGGRSKFMSDKDSKMVIDKDWWRGAVIYQIYPRSFQDSNGDGIGDLKGITHRLDYIAELGVDAIWISPFFTSPMLDFGYDVSDYTAVDSMFGTIADFDEMIAKAHDLGLRVMIDQVISHSSDQHDWFKESRFSKDNDRADWYVWADAKPEGSPPNNWLSIFGGSAWEWDTNRCQFYLHNFLKSQPDLNFHNEEVQNALLDTVRFWLERGVDGFRLDTINFYFHDVALKDNPVLAMDRRNEKIAPAVNPYNFQDHLHDKNQPENIEFLKRFRALLDEYPAATAVGEVGDAQYGMELVSDYTSGGDKIHMCYAFDFLSSAPLTSSHVRDVVEQFEEKAPDGWACWAFSNHDVVRHASRWDDAKEYKTAFLKMTANLILSLRGSVCLYQGEELGLTEVEIEFEQLRDPYGIQFWPTFKGRDGCRTPMVWDSGNGQAGFTEGSPWLPISAEHMRIAVDVQEKDETSLLSHYKEMLHFRSQYLEFSKGNIRFLDCVEGVLLFERSLGAAVILVAINMSDEAVSIEVDGDKFSALSSEIFGSELIGNKVVLPAFASWFGTNKENNN